MSEFIAHMAGDYGVQSHWMATEKTSNALPAAVHAMSYTACFLPLTRNPKALLLIGGTHYLIDRYRLAKHVAWLKNQVGPKASRPGHTATGYSDDLPPWLSTWLMILLDNTMHLLINHHALKIGRKK